MCNNNRVRPADITVTQAIGSTASPYYILCNITQLLCRSCCVDQTPVFSPQFSLLSVSAVGTGQYVATVQCTGIIAYQQCNCGCQGQLTQLVNQTFTIPFAYTATTSAPTPTVTLTSGITVNALSVDPCKNCTRHFVSETPLTLTVS
jgi:hypothetical protein